MIPLKKHDQTASLLLLLLLLLSVSVLKGLLADYGVHSLPCREQVYVVQGEMNGFYKMTLGIPLSINHESSTGLTALPGVGPGLAGAIVEERKRRGGFKSLEELTSVRGIGAGLFRRIRPYVKLS